MQLCPLAFWYPHPCRYSRLRVKVENTWCIDDVCCILPQFRMSCLLNPDDNLDFVLWQKMWVRSITQTTRNFRSQSRNLQCSSKIFFSATFIPIFFPICYFCPFLPVKDYQSHGTLWLKSGNRFSSGLKNNWVRCKQVVHVISGFFFCRIL